MDPMVLVLIVTALLLLLLVLGMPVAFALALCGAIGLAALRSLGLAAQMLGVTPLEKIANIEGLTKHLESVKVRFD